jgi:hypothetical protein
MKMRVSSGQSAMEFLSAVFVATLLLAWTMGKLPIPWAEKELHQGIDHGLHQADITVQHLAQQAKPIGEKWARQEGEKLVSYGQHAIINVPGEFVRTQRLNPRPYHEEETAPINLPIKASVSQGVCSILFSCQPQELLHQSQIALEKLKTTVGM